MAQRSRSRPRSTEGSATAILEITSDAWVVLDREWRYTYLNRAAERIAGLRREEMLGRTIREVSPERAPTFEAACRRAMEERAIVHLEERYAPLDTWFGHTVYPSTDTVTVCTREITERKRMEEALRESEERFRRYFELGLIGMAITSPTKGIIEVNDRICEILGYERNELLQSTWAELTHPDDLAIDIENFNRVMAGESDAYAIDKRWIRKDGQVIDATISVKCMRRPDGSVHYFVGLLQDITERKRMEEALREKERFIRQVAELTPVLINVFDLVTERDSYISPDVVNVVGYTPDEIAQMNDPFALWHPEDIPRAKEHLARSKRAADGEINELEFRVRRRDGEWRWLATRSVPFTRNEHGDVWQIVTATLDITEHKQADEAVKRSEEHWRSLIENASDIISMVASDGTVRYESPSTKRILGYQPEELIGKNAFDFIHPDDLPQVAEDFTRTLDPRNETTEYLSCRFRHKNGSWRVLEGVGKLFVDQSGELVGLFNSRDVTERRRGEEALRASEERLRLLVESAEDYAIITFDTDGRVSSWSSGAARMFGYAEAEIIGCSGEILFTPEDRERGVPLQELKQAREEGRASNERYCLRKDGMRFFSSGVTTVLRHHSEQGYVKIARDLTERKRAEEALRRANDVLEQRVVERTKQLTVLNEELRRSEAYLAEGQRLSHTGSYAWNVFTGETFWSEETYRIYGFEPGVVKPSYESFCQIIHPDERLSLQQTFEKVLRERSDYNVEFRAVRPDGTIRNIWSVGHPVFNASGEFAEFIGTVMDVTEGKRAEESLHAARAELAHMARVTTMGELAASIAHEVGQPLTAVITDANACLRWLEGPQPNLDEARQSVTRIVREGHRAGNVIQKIRSLLKKERQRMIRLDLNKVIDEVLTLLSYEISRNNISLQTELEATLPTIKGDRVQLQQVILNLVMNATEATATNRKETGRILVTSERQEPDKVVFSIHDSGAGIDPKNMGQLFTPFFTTKPGGMGMGLSISRSIIEAHGGRLWAVPNETEGATFKFSLPSHNAN